MAMSSQFGICSVKKAHHWIRFSLTSQRRFSANATNAAVEGTTVVKVEQNGLVARHGEGDGVITLNVGGKEFITLRSTIQNNPVLLKRVTQAEANQEFYKGAVYIDRDPTLFSYILQHLRNRADLMHSRKTFEHHSELSKYVPEKAHTIFKKKDVLIQLPHNKDALRDLYVEARYFQIVELESLLCAMDWHTRLASWFGAGATNPFYAASQTITAARNALVATSGIGIALGTQNTDLMENVKGLFRDLRSVVRGDTPSDKDTVMETQKDETTTEGSRGIFSFR